MNNPHARRLLGTIALPVQGTDDSACVVRDCLLFEGLVRFNADVAAIEDDDAGDMIEESTRKPIRACIIIFVKARNWPCRGDDVVNGFVIFIPQGNYDKLVSSAIVEQSKAVTKSRSYDNPMVVC